MKKHWQNGKGDQEIEELLEHYANLQKGNGSTYIEEESF